MVREIGSSVDYRKLTSVRGFASLSDPVLVLLQCGHDLIAIYS